MPLILLFMLSCVAVNAVTFGLQSIDQQLKEADGIFQGYYLDKRSIKLENGELATQMIFKVKKEHGLQSQLYGMDEVIVHYPVGKAGIPEFIIGENVVLFIKVESNRYWGQNLGYGSYKLINYGQKSILINTLLPEDEKYGQIALEDFETRIREIKGVNLKVVTADQSLNLEEGLNEEFTTTEASVSRSIASEEINEEKDGPLPDLDSYRLVMILAFCGGLFRLMRQKRS